jgi:tagatose 1,6-diphosphate aldolase
VKALSIGKLRGLQQCATPRGALSVFALDHRNNLRRALRPDAPDTVIPAEMSAFKQQVVSALAPATSAVLLDPEVGAAQCIAGEALPGNIGLVVAVEATGYTGESDARQSRILPGWSIEKAKRMGASAIKLLVYYHPDSPTAADIEALVARVAADCATWDLPLMLEPLSYSLNPTHKKLSSVEKRRVVMETARRLLIDGVEVLKAEFPLDVIAEPDEQAWFDACAELSAACPVPWVLLSAGVNYETYLRQVVIACEAGASGVTVVRAVWKEAVDLTGQAHMDFLRGEAYERLRRVTALCDALARPWTDFFTSPVIGPDWYKRY